MLSLDATSEYLGYFRSSLTLTSGSAPFCAKHYYGTVSETTSERGLVLPALSTATT
jgi:hypothetical protein